MVAFSDLEQEELELLGKSVRLSRPGILYNSYVISPTQELDEILAHICASIQEKSDTQTKITVIKKDYVNSVIDGNYSNPQALLVECANEILNAKGSVVILAVTGFENFYTRNISFNNQPIVSIEEIDLDALKAGHIRPKVNLQHFYDQSTVSLDDFGKTPGYQTLADNLAVNHKKLFCLFHVGEGLHPAIETIARNSIYFSQFNRRLVNHGLEIQAPRDAQQVPKADSSLTAGIPGLDI